MRHFVIFILAIFCFIACDNTKSNTELIIPVPKVSSKDPAIVPVVSPAENGGGEWWIDRHNNKINNIILNQKIIFIGNSITHFWEEAEGIDAWNELNVKYNNKITNLGFAADLTQHVIWRLKNGEFPTGINPEYVVLMIGTNNASYLYEPESTAAGIGEIVKILNKNSPESKIILCSILPRDSGNDDDNTKQNNAVNEIIKNYSGFLNIEYLNLGQYYVDNQGNLKDELFTDRVHLTAEGYKIWKNKLLEIVK